VTENNENPYAGRWIARLHGRVIAQGGTPEQVRRAAQSRYRESPEVLFMPIDFPLTFPTILEEVRNALPKEVPIYLVGGAVRDALSLKRVHDLDFVMEKNAIQTARRVANKLKADFYILDNERDTGRVITKDRDGSRMMMDFAAFRGKDLISDLQGRDFTVNAIAIDLRDNSVLDPLGGGVDLKEKRLRACSALSFRDDPVRILRGVRLAANFGFTILPETRLEMKKAVPNLGKSSPERIRDELFRILEGRQPSTCMRALDILKVLEQILPELTKLKGESQPSPHVYSAWEHSLSVLGHLDDILSALAKDFDPEKASNLFDGSLVLHLGRYRNKIAATISIPISAARSSRGLLFLAALYHDVAKPLSVQIDEYGQRHFWGHDQRGAELLIERARALALGNDEIHRLELIVRNHMRVLSLTNRLVQEGNLPSRRAIYRFFQGTGQAGVDICLLSLADIRATYEETLPQEIWIAALEVVHTLLEAWYERKEEQVAPVPLLNGNDLMRELSIKPGKLVGELLEAIREAQAMGLITTQQQALKLAHERFEATGSDE
jgi:poly(A) polymerase